MVSQQPNLEIQEEEMAQTSIAAIHKNKGKVGEKKEKNKYPPPPYKKTNHQCNSVIFSQSERKTLG